MLRVLQLTSSPWGIGGVERLLLDSAGRFDRDRFEISYCNLFDEKDGNGEFSGGLRQRGAPYFHIPGCRYRDLPGIVLRLASLLRREKIQVLQVQMLHATIVGVVAARLARVPVVLVNRQYTDEGYDNHGALIRKLDLSLTQTANHVTTCSAQVRDTILSQTTLPPERVGVIHNGIDLAAFDAAARAGSPFWDRSWENGILLGTAGSLNPRKGHADLLHALARVLKVRPDVRLVIVGEGRERARLEALADRLGIRSKVLLAGFQMDVATLMQHLTFYVHPSRHEPFGISLIEAMGARKAIVASAVGGIPDIVVDGQTGLLVPPSDPESLAEAILRLIREPEAAQRMGERGRARVEECFTISTVVDRYQELFSCLAERVEVRNTIGSVGTA